MDDAVAVGSQPTVPATPIVPDGATPAAPSTDGPDTTGARRSVQARMESLVRREELANLRQRMLSTIVVGTSVWLLFIFGDVVNVLRETAPVWLVVLLRTFPTTIAAVAYLHLRRVREPSFLTMRAYELAIFTSAVVMLSIHSVTAFGWGSPRLPIICLIVVGHSTLLGTRWQRMLLPVGAMLLAVPLTMLAATPLVEGASAELSDPAVMGEFAFNYSYVLGAGVLALFGGHTMWKLRREVALARSIGRYRLRRRIGQGGMGEVWAAYHEGLQRDVAVKLVHPRHGRDEAVLARFDREVHTLAELTHPNTVRVYDYGATAAGTFYYAMELLQGIELARLVLRDGPLAPSRAIALTAQAAEALGEAHQHGIVHRDVTPGNLLLIQPTPTVEFVKLIDFGIAKAHDPDEKLTQAGFVVGTPGYIAPEVLRGGEATPRSDVYSLGLVLYLLLTGVEPVDLEHPSAEIPPPSEHREGIDPRVDDIVMRCLARDPQARFEDGIALASALHKYA